MCKIKSRFSGWREVDENTAKKWAAHLYNGITTMTAEQKTTYINKWLNGTTFQALMK